MEEGKIGDGQLLFITNSLDTWNPAAQGSTSRVFNCIMMYHHLPKPAAIKFMRLGVEKYAAPAFSTEAQILGIMSDSPAVVQMLSCGFIKPENTDILLNENSNDLRKLTGVVRNFIGETDTFLTQLDHYVSDGWLPYIVLPPLSPENNLLPLCDPSYTPNHTYFPLSQALDLLVQACSVLDEAHNRNVVYLDHKIIHYYWDEKHRLLKLIDWNFGQWYPEGLPDEIRREDIRQFVTRVAYHLLTGRIIPGALAYQSTPEMISAQVKRTYDVRWTIEDKQRLPEELRTIIELAIQGHFRSAKMLQEIFKDPAIIRGIAPEILIKYDDFPTMVNVLHLKGRKPVFVNEAKIIFIGQGSVGKTSLVKRILEDKYSSSQLKTDGISIEHWQIKNRRFDLNNDEYPKINLNIWDFGGQEIMHATHQFFLTKRSLYLLVLDSRLTLEENRVEYWLKIIQSFGGESPVLIVGNKIDQHPLDIDRTGLQKKYSNIVGILETSAATGAGIEALKTAITEQVNNLPHVRDLLPETWFTVKTKLEELGRQSNFITHDKYLDLCAENEVSDETSQRTLIGFLHDLGVVLHFQDDPRLEALGILNPQWVTNGVYKILNSHILFQNKGVLTTSMLDEILNLPEYPRGKRLFIVDMMKKFELCYDIEPDKTFLVPDLLPKDEPATDGRENALAFQYHYAVLPSSVITRFIVRMNEFVQEKVWRTGVVLKDGGSTALVKADTEDRKVFIWVSGDEHKRHDFLSKIRGQFDAIHKTITRLDAKEMVPVSGHPEAEPVDYDLLLQMDHNNVDVYPVLSNGKMIVVNVKAMLNGVARELDRQRNNVTNFYIGGDVKDSTIIAGNENEVNN